MAEYESHLQTSDIIVVDDTPDNLRLLIGILAEQGYKVRPASDGAFALKSAHLDPPDLILLDVKMPGMDGYAVCEQLKADERTRDIPVIFISALNDVNDKIKGLKLGGVDYITKPFQAEEVLARVRTHVALRNLQKDLQKANHQLQEANASKDKLFSVIAHDLRSPFSGLIALTEVLIENIEQYSKEQIQTKLGYLHSSSKTVYALLTNLLTWSRLERGLMTCEPQKLRLADIAEQNILLFTSNADRKQITLKHLIPIETIAYADENMVDTILRNILSNALKFTETGGTVEISHHHRDEHFVEIVVADTGIGMSQETIEKLFRLDLKYTQRGTADEDGTGLGLILCKELVEKNGGTIRVESEVGKGTTFTFTLPTAPPDEAD